MGGWVVGRRARRLVDGALAVAVAALLSGGSPGPADAGNITIRGGVAGGGLTLQTDASASLGASLDGNDQVVAGDLGAATVTDATGTGAGWNLTVTASPFTTADGRRLASSALRVTGVTVGRATGIAPANGVTYPVTVPLDGGPAKFFSAGPGTGLGRHVVTPAVTLSVPADADAGAYQATIMLSVVAGP